MCARENVPGLSVGRRPKGMRMRFRFASVLLVAAALTACVSSPNPEAEKRAKAWRMVNNTTDVTVVGENRLRLISDTPFAAGGDEMEKAMLLRAAGEAIDRDYPRLAIVYVDYHQRGIGGWFGPDLGDSTKRWIGTYEDLLSARDRADLDGSLDSPFGFKSMDVVIRLLAEDEEPTRAAFSTEAIFENLIDDRIDRHNLQANPRVAIPKLKTPNIFKRNR